MNPIRLVIADDHRFYREGVRTMLHAIPQMDVVGEAARGEETIAQARAHQPDVILMDMKMPGINGIEATRRILQQLPQIGILVVTMFDDDETVFAAMRAGARGYLLKDADQEELVRAITAVHRGEAIFSPMIAHRMMHYFRALPSTAALAFPHLTEREREILRYIAQGQSNGAIAKHLTLSLKTVQNHVSNVLNKLQVTDRTQAMIRAKEAGLDREDTGRPFDPRKTRAPQD